MVWYPSVADIVSANKKAVSKDKHRHKLLRSTEAIQGLVDRIKLSEQMGLTFQAARFMKELVLLHAFDGGNHRTAYSITNLFLIENGITVSTVPSSISYPFVKAIAGRNIGEVQAWIIKNMVES